MQSNRALNTQMPTASSRSEDATSCNIMTPRKHPQLQCQHAQHPGWQLDFLNIGFTVRDRASGADKAILSGVSGCARPGRLFALMGGSGAGKTTLLDRLACNETGGGGTLSGQVFVNGARRDPREFCKASCYVMQKDLLYASATVRECVTTSALLRLPMTMTRAAKRERVEEVLKELEIQSCAETLIGDDIIGIKGVSGGQKRRVSLAIELVKDPKVIFADEPTSGLDSEVALSIMDALLMLARKQRTVVCTIHQPNSDITDMFDDFMLLALGRCVFHGPWRSSVDWFANQGFRTPTYKNPSDFFMSIIRDAEVANRLADMHHEEQVKVAELAAIEEGRSVNFDAALQQRLQGLAAPGSPHHASMIAANRVLGQSSSARAANNTAGTAGTAGASDPEAGPHVLCTLKKTTSAAGAVAATWGRLLSRSASTTSTVMAGPAAAAVGVSLRSSSEDEGASMWFQVVVLCTRILRNWIRSPVMLASEFVQYIFISVFAGLMYCGGLTDDVDGVYNRAACIWFAFAIMSFTPSYTAVTSWNSERHLLKKELQQRQYGVTAFYIARTLVTMPLQLIENLIFVLIMYFFVGFQVDAAKFFLFFAVLSMFQLICEGLGLLCSILTRHATYAIIMLTFSLLLLLSFSGFLITKIPVYFIWINKASFLTYAYTGLMQSQLEGLMVTDPQDPEALVEAITLLPSVLDNGLTLPQNIGILTAMWGFMELLKLVALHLAYRTGLI